MATYTEKLGLKLPAQTDFYNVDDFNENFRKIDQNTAQNSDIQQVLTLADPIRSNRAPTTADAQFAGKLWVVPKMIFNNMMLNALAQAAGNWRATAATVSTSGTAATLVGNGTASTIVGEVNMTAVRANDIVYINAKMAVTADANSAIIELLCGNNVIATTSMSIPTTGDSTQLIGYIKVDEAGVLKLRVTTMYNSASVQLGKGVTVSDITILDLTADMCQNFAGIEFTKDETTAYINTYGKFQTKTYELSECWWICRGSYGGQYSWQRYDDYTNAVINEYSTNYQNSKATTAEAQDGSNDAHWMTPLKTQQFFTNRLATQSEADVGTNTTKAMTPALVKRRANPYYSSNVGDVIHTVNNAEVETNGAFIKMDGRTIDVNSGYPLLKNTYELNYRIADPTSIVTSGHGFSASPTTSSSAWVGTSYFFTCTYAQSTSSSYHKSLCIRRANGTVTRLLSNYANVVIASNNQAICITSGNLQVKAYVYDADGTQVRVVSLNTTTNAGDVRVYTFGSTIYVMFKYNGYVHGYYSTDNFATYGTSTWAGAAQYSNSKYPWTSFYSPNISGIQQASNGDLYLPVTDSFNSSITYTRMLRSIDLGRTWTVAWSIAHDDASKTPYESCWFIDGSYAYLNGYYVETVSSSTKYNRQVLLKYNLSNGTYIGQTPQLYSSSDGTLAGFVKNGYAYIAGQYWSYIIKLSDLSISPWRFQGSVLNSRSCISYITENRRYWLFGSEYMNYYPTYSEGSQRLYGGLIVYDTELGQGVYVTGILPTSTSSGESFNFGGFGEDSDGNVYFPLGYQSSNTFQYSNICKLEFHKKTLPSLDYAYIKAKEMT